MTQPLFLPALLQPRHDGWTPERQWKFVEGLAATASITKAARMVGMSVRSAQRLRRHPLAGDFRAAWDAALGQAWGQLEQVALDRAINGEREIIERDGYVVGERRRPCSDRLMIHLLGSRERALAAARAERIAAHKQATAEARLAAIVHAAGQSAAQPAAQSGRKRGAAAAPAPPPPEVADLRGDAAAETAALHAFRAQASGFASWPPMEEDDRPFAVDADGTVWLSPASGYLPHFNCPPEPERPHFDFATRPRLEDYQGTAADAKPPRRKGRETADDATFGTF